MSWRQEDDEYNKLKALWWESVERAHVKNKGTRVGELDNLMLSSYRLCRCIRNYLRSGDVEIDLNVPVPLLPEAIQNAKDIMGRRKGGLPSLFNEADCLEAVSRASYRWLKDNKKLIEIRK